MSLNLPNVSVLGLSQDSRFFGAGFQYASFRRLSIVGTINDLAASFGITGIWSGEDGLLETVRNNHDYQSLTLNGVDFGSGRIESISFDAGLDVKTKNYQAAITVFDSGNTFNLTGTYYSGLNITNFKYLQSFSENYSFERKLNGGYGYTHNASIQFTSGVGQLNAIQAAQSAAQSLFTGANIGFAFYSGFTNKQGKRYITENYNLIDNSCSFQETFNFDNNNGNYSAIYTTSVQLDEKGYVTAVENGTIRGIENPNYQKALSAVDVEMTGSYYRCSGAANVYFPTGAILIESPVSQGRSIDIFNNVIGYTVTFDNSPINQRFYFWNYTLQAARQDGVTTVTENGNVVGRGDNPSICFTKAQSGFSLVKIGIQNRCSGMFVGGFIPSTNYLNNKQESYSPTQGQISYNYEYSNDPTLIANAGIRKKTVTEEDNIPIYSYNKLGIFNYSEIIQNNYQSTQGGSTITISMEGDKSIGLSNFLSEAVTEINLRQPVGSDRYVGNANYTYNPNENNASVRLTWLYNTSASQNIVP